MFFPGFELNVAGSEWFIIFIVIVIFIFPKKITSMSKSIGRLVGEYEKAKGKIIAQKNSLVLDTTTVDNNHDYKGPQIHRPVSSEREKLELIAKSLNINSEELMDEELRNQISSKLKQA